MIGEFHIALAAPEEVLLSEIRDKRMTRDDVALTYALALASPPQPNWRTVNEAIIERWSMSALRYIKEKAWRIYNGKHGAASAVSTGRNT